MKTASTSKASRNLGTLGGNFGQANAVNEVGEVVGWATNTGDQAALAFLWKNGVTSLGTLAGDVCSHAFGIQETRWWVHPTTTAPEAIRTGFFGKTAK
jgi:probable HAF family extracellular repeat protein